MMRVVMVLVALVVGAGCAHRPPRNDEVTATMPVAAEGADAGVEAAAPER